jgi:hypothetical protein
MIFRIKTTEMFGFYPVNPVNPANPDSDHLKQVENRQPGSWEVLRLLFFTQIDPNWGYDGEIFKM